MRIHAKAERLASVIAEQLQWSSNIRRVDRFVCASDLVEELLINRPETIDIEIGSGNGNKEDRCWRGRLHKPLEYCSHELGAGTVHVGVVTVWLEIQSPQ